MDTITKLNHVLMLKKEEMQNKSFFSCKKNPGPCVLVDHKDNKALSELWIIDALNLCPLNHHSNILESITKNIFSSTIDKEQAYSYLESIYFIFSLIEEEIMLSIKNNTFNCSDIQTYMEVINKSVERIY